VKKNTTGIFRIKQKLNDNRLFYFGNQIYNHLNILEIMPEQQVFQIEQELDRAAMATELRWLADAVETGEVTPEGEAPIALPKRCRYEFERLTSSETDEVRHELEVEIRWTT